MDERKMKKKIDSLGRIGIPKAIREQMELKADDPILIDFDPHEFTKAFFEWLLWVKYL